MYIWRRMKIKFKFYVSLIGFCFVETEVFFLGEIFRAWDVIKFIRFYFRNKNFFFFSFLFDPSPDFPSLAPFCAWFIIFSGRWWGIIIIILWTYLIKRAIIFYLRFFFRNVPVDYARLYILCCEFSHWSFVLQKRLISRGEK